MTTDIKTLVRILIGVAWLDSRIQPEERRYLRRIAQEKGIEDDREIRPLLHELRAVKPEECYQWLRDYLGDRPTSETCQNLIESVSALNLQRWDGDDRGSQTPSKIAANRH